MFFHAVIVICVASASKMFNETHPPSLSEQLDLQHPNGTSEIIITNAAVYTQQEIQKLVQFMFVLLVLIIIGIVIKTCFDVQCRKKEFPSYRMSTLEQRLDWEAHHLDEHRIHIN